MSSVSFKTSENPKIYYFSILLISKNFKLSSVRLKKNSPVRVYQLSELSQFHFNPITFIRAKQFLSKNPAWFIQNSN